MFHGASRLRVPNCSQARLTDEVRAGFECNECEVGIVHGAVGALSRFGSDGCLLLLTEGTHYDYNDQKHLFIHTFFLEKYAYNMYGWE